MTGMFVCIVEPRLDCRAKGSRHAVIRIMRSWSQRKDKQTCVLLCTGTCAGTGVRVWISPASATAKSHNSKLNSQTFTDVCRSSRFAAHLGDISQCVHLFCINFVKTGKSWAPVHQNTHTHTSWFPLERIPLLWAWHLRRWLYKPLVNALWFPNAE